MILRTRSSLPTERMFWTLREPRVKTEERGNGMVGLKARGVEGAEGEGEDEETEEEEENEGKAV